MKIILETHPAPKIDIMALSLRIVNFVLMLFG